MLFRILDNLLFVAAILLQIFCSRQSLIDEYIHKSVYFYEQNMIIVNDKPIDYK